MPETPLPSLTYVRCIVVETETEVPGLALIQLHDDLPPVHYVPLDDLIELTYEYEQPLDFTAAANARRPVGPWEEWSGLPETVDAALGDTEDD